VHVAHAVGCEMRMIFWLEIMKGRDRSEDISVNRRIILEWILGK
jgi:hypothetical protein